MITGKIKKHWVMTILHSNDQRIEVSYCVVIVRPGISANRDTGAFSTVSFRGRINDPCICVLREAD